jgi:hypothetical protein
VVRGPITPARGGHWIRVATFADSEFVGIFGTTPTPPLPGLSPAERSAARDRKAGPTKGVAAKRAEDTVTVATESDSAVRGLAGNGQEEAHEDRQEHPQYTPEGELAPDQRPSLDIQG